MATKPKRPNPMNPSLGMPSPQRASGGMTKTKPRVSKIPDWYKTNRKTGKVSGKTPGWARPGKGDGNTAFLRVNGGRNPRRGGSGSGGSSGGGGGGGGGASSSGRARPPKKTKPPKPPAASTAPTATPGEDPDRKMWEELFGPARREIERQKALLEQKKAADTAAWDSYNKWAEDQRAKTAGLLTTAQKDQAAAYSAQKAASDANIKSFIDAARGGSGAPPQGGDMAQATGMEAAAGQAAAQQSAAGLRGDYNATMAAIANQRVADEANINKAIAQEGTNNLTGQYTKASNALASKAADIETSYQQAKLDKFYKDRQYGLDRETLDWTKSLQGGQLALEQQKLAISAQAQTLKAQMDANKFNAQQRQQTIQNAFEERRISQADRDYLLRAAGAGATQGNANSDRITKAMDWVTKNYPTFQTDDTKEQGHAMALAAQRFKAMGLTAAQAREAMAGSFGARFTSVQSALNDFNKVYKPARRRRR